MLENFGCKVELADSGDKALEMYKPGNYDFILMDIEMPQMDGVETTKHLREAYGINLPPIIGVSANAMVGQAEKYIAQGLDDYLSKPVGKTEMAEMLLKWKTVER